VAIGTSPSPNDQEQSALSNDEIVKRVRAKYALVRSTSKRGSDIVDEIVRGYSDDLDTFFETFDQYLDSIKNGERDDYSDNDLQRMVGRIPILLYRLSEMVDVASIESDVAKAMRDNVVARNYITAPGKTIPEKQSYANVMTADETAVVDLAKHVYFRLKQKLEHGNMLFDAVRKIMTNRENDKSVFGKDRK
jgi:hypothetical protein